MFSSKGKKFGFTIAALLSISLLVYACGGGGGGSSSSGVTGTTGSKAAATSTTVTNTALQITSSAISGSFPKPSLSKGSFGSKTKAWSAFLKAKANQKTRFAPIACDSGTVDETPVYDSPTTTLTSTTTASNCVTSLGPSLGSFVIDGTLAVVETDNTYTGNDPTNDLSWDPHTFSITATNFTFTSKDAGGNISSQFGINGVMTSSLGTGVGNAFVAGSDPNQDGLYPDGTVTISSLTFTSMDDNGTPNDTSDDTNDSFSVTNLSETIHINTFDVNGEPTDLTSTIASGTIIVNDAIDNTNDINASFTNLVTDYAITTANGIETETIDINGVIDSACLGGPVTLATITSIVIVDDACPTSGILTVTGSGGTATVTFTNTGGVSVDNPDGTTTDFADCEDASACG